MKKPPFKFKFIFNKTVLKTAGICGGIIAALLMYLWMFQGNIVMLFVLINAVLTGGGMLALLMMAPNEFQTSVTRRNRWGYGFTAFGILLFGLAGCFATGLFNPMYKTFDLSSMFALMAGNVSGMLIFLGITIALDDTVTDPFLDTKNIPWLALGIVVLIGIAYFIFGLTYQKSLQAFSVYIP